MKTNGSEAWGDRFDLEGRAGFLVLFDVIEWVPQLELNGGWRYGPDADGLITSLGLSVRRYFSMDYSLEFGFTWVQAFSGTELNEYRLGITGWFG